MQKERLHKIIARAGICSRRQAEKLISKGRVMVNHKTVKKLGTTVEPTQDKIYVDGQLLLLDKYKKFYYLAYKPARMLTTLFDPKKRPTVQDILHKYHINIKLFPVGRLDWDAEGLLLFTNDGELANKIMHPRTHLPKIYLVKIKGRPSPKNLISIRSGLRINARTKYLPARVSIIKKMHRFTILKITLYEGKQNQIKKIFNYFGHPVLQIKRVAIGPLKPGRLTPGALRPLTPAELKKLKNAIKNRVKVDALKK